MYFIFGLIAYWLRRRKWRKLADRLGLQLAERGLEMTGTFAGCPARVQIYNAAGTGRIGNDGSDWRTYFALDLRAPLAPTKLHIAKEGFADKINEKLGIGEDLETGDHDFDKLVSLSAEDPTSLLRLLDPQLRHELTELLQADGNTEIREGQVVTQFWRRTSDEERIRQTLEHLARVADVVERAHARSLS